MWFGDGRDGLNLRWGSTTGARASCALRSPVRWLDEPITSLLLACAVNGLGEPLVPIAATIEGAGRRQKKGARRSERESRTRER
jgi:hypothetical protein